MANVLLLGLDEAAAHKIETVSNQAGHTVRRETLKTDVAARPQADVIFLSGDDRNYLRILRAIRAYHQAPPVVVVTRLAEASGWIDALEAGATDYCAAPLESMHLKWAMESALSRPKAFAA